MWPFELNNVPCISTELCLVPATCINRPTPLQRGPWILPISQLLRPCLRYGYLHCDSILEILTKEAVIMTRRSCSFYDFDVQVATEMRDDDDNMDAVERGSDQTCQQRED